MLPRRTDRLLSTANVPRIHALLRTVFGDTVGAVERMRRMQLCSLWVLAIAVPRPLPVAFDAAHVEGSDKLSWVCNTTKKLGQGGAGEGESWTLVSTRTFGAQNKVRVCVCFVSGGHCARCL